MEDRENNLGANVDLKEWQKKFRKYMRALKFV
jgi:hypothetical protein